VYENIGKAWSEHHRLDRNFFEIQNLIMGGTLLISDQGEIVYTTLEVTVGDLPDFDGLARAGQALTSPEDGEAQFNTAMSPEALKMAGFDFSRVK
jgi:hypothetical protein